MKLQAPAIGGLHLHRGGALKIVSGAWIEDKYDIVYHLGIGETPYFHQGDAQVFADFFDLNPRKNYTTFTHFWNANNGPYSNTILSDYLYGSPDLFWSAEAPNSMVKIRKYINGNYNSRWLHNQAMGHGNMTVVVTGADFEMISCSREICNPLRDRWLLEFYSLPHVLICHCGEKTLSKV